MPLDKTRAPVRRWRKAQRVIRGIAGGQWYAPSWVGEKDSAYAVATGRAPTTVDGENTIPASAISCCVQRQGEGEVRRCDRPVFERCVARAVDAQASALAERASGRTRREVASWRAGHERRRRRRRRIDGGRRDVDG